jgi:hypothetical protein
MPPRHQDQEEVTADGAGRVTLPVMTVKKVGSYSLWGVSAGQAPRYLRLHFLPVPAPRIQLCVPSALGRVGVDCG